MDRPQAAKPLHWIGSSLTDLRRTSQQVRDVVGFALHQAQQGRLHVDAKPLRGFGGAGVVESVADDRSGTYRTVYTVSLPSAVYVLHVFQKKSRRGIATPREHLATIERRLQAAIAHHREHHEQAKQATKRSEER